MKIIVLIFATYFFEIKFDTTLRKTGSSWDFTQLLCPFYQTWPSPNYKKFPLDINARCDIPDGKAYPFSHLVWYCICSNYQDQFAKNCHNVQSLTNFLRYVPKLTSKTIHALTFYFQNKCACTVLPCRVDGIDNINVLPQVVPPRFETLPCHVPWYSWTVIIKSG